MTHQRIRTDRGQMRTFASPLVNEPHVITDRDAAQ